MNGLLKASRIAFICNVAFLACVLLKYVSFSSDPMFTSLLLVLGWVMAGVLNAVVNVVVLVFVLRKRPVLVPMWLRWANALLFIVELYYFLIQ